MPCTILMLICLNVYAHHILHTFIPCTLLSRSTKRLHPLRLLQWAPRDRHWITHLLTSAFRSLLLLISYPEWPHRQGGCSHAAVARGVPLMLHGFILCTWRAGGTAREGGGCDQSIGSIRSWLWLTATRSSPLGCFSTILQVVDN